MKSMDEVYALLAYDGAPLLRVPVCVNRAFLVNSTTRLLANSKRFSFSGIGPLPSGSNIQNKSKPELCWESHCWRSQNRRTVRR